MRLKLNLHERFSIAAVARFVAGRARFVAGRFESRATSTPVLGDSGATDRWIPSDVILFSANENESSAPLNRLSLAAKIFDFFNKSRVVARGLA